jgi:peroxiredoxin
MKNIEIAIGSEAPDFKLTAEDGNVITLSDYLGRQNIYLFFVREFN